MTNKKLTKLFNKLNATQPATPQPVIPLQPDTCDRRSFLQKAGLGGLSLSSFMFASTEDQLDHATQKVNKNSNPSDLKITDLRIAEVQGAPFRCPLVRIDTNQGIYGLGEVRDNASMRYALFLKSRLMGENPCNVNRVFKKIKQFGHHGRQGGGVSAVEMALWDLTGKAYNVPVYQLLGGKFRDKVRLYADTTNVRAKDKDEYTNVVKGRIAKGFNFLKIDIELDMIQDIPGALVNHKQYGKLQGYSSEYGSYGQMEHPFTAIQITDKGAKALADYVARIRDAVGYDIPMAADHFGHFGVNGCIKLANALEPYQIAWLEDLVPWKYTEMWKEITQSIELPTMTGEDIYLKEEFIKLIDARAVDMIHPDLATAGGILETKKIGDYAEDHGIPMAMHFAGTPVSFMANVHCAAATQNFVALEHHSIDVPWWEDMVTGIDKPMVKDGFVTVPNKPGLGIELNEKVVKEHLVKDTGYFLPTPEWNTDRSWDRLWS
jgi:L-alanine-DL-glutamate epimerase-like enolase superfamily enzyme